MSKLVLKSARSAAVTYSFETDSRDDGFHSWALCTVNDMTGELLITSDWGSWSYRWNASPRALGAPSLTAFIGGRGGGDVDYLARKLQGGTGRRFSAEATAKALQRRLCERRLNDGRNQLEHRLEPDDLWGGKLPGHLVGRYTNAGLPLYRGSGLSDKFPYLSTEVARFLWKDIDNLAAEMRGSNGDLFFERLGAIDGFDLYVTGEPWEYAETEQTPEDKALRDIVLPALIEACQASTASRPEELKEQGA